MSGPITLRPLTLLECEEVRVWRNADDVRLGLRTPFPLTADMQADFYKAVVCNRQSVHRYFALVNDRVFVGMGGLTDCQWENGVAELSLIIHPQFRSGGTGTAAVGALLAEAFERLRLQTVFGECYEINTAVDFWRRVVARYGAYETSLPSRKFWNGRFHDSYYFSVSVAQWRAQAGVAA